jgi:hypothetical protein
VAGAGHEFITHPEGLAGYRVRGLDGRIGIVVEANRDAMLVRKRILRRHVVIPARAVNRIDDGRRTVWLNRTRREVSRIPQPTAKRQAWFVPASLRVPGTNPVIGVEPPEDEESS